MNASESRKTILLVDDDVDYLMQEQMQLEAAGFEVRTAENVETAMESLRDAKTDLAVIDLMLEHMDDGFVLCHQMKRERPLMPVILVTGVEHETGIAFDAATEEERSWVKADALLSKPVRFEQLQREIEKLLKE